MPIGCRDWNNTSGFNTFLTIPRRILIIPASEQARCYFCENAGADNKTWLDWLFPPLDHLQWFSGLDAGNCSGLKWVLDNSWAINHVTVRRKATRLIIRMLAAAGILWLALMSMLISGIL